MTNIKGIRLLLIIVLLLGSAVADGEEDDDDDDFSGGFSGDDIGLTCDETDRPVSVIVSSEREVTEDDLQNLEGHIVDQANSYCRSDTQSYCSLLLGSDFSDFDTSHVDACVSEISREQKRQSTITTTIAVVVVDPDDTSQPLAGRDILTIVDLAVDDFERDTGLTVEEVVLDDEDDIFDYIPIVIGVVVGVAVPALLSLFIVAIIVIAVLLIAKKSRKKNRVNPNTGERRPLQSRNSTSSSDSLLSTHAIH